MKLRELTKKKYHNKLVLVNLLHWNEQVIFTDVKKHGQFDLTANTLRNGELHQGVFSNEDINILNSTEM